MSLITIKDYRLGIDSNINRIMRGLHYSGNGREIEYKVIFDGVVDTPEDIDDFGKMAKALLANGVTPVMATFAPIDYEGYGKNNAGEMK